MYKVPSGSLDLGKLQDEVLEKWKRENSFKESILNRAQAEEFVFYDGPPFANGLPHYGHLLTSYIKDAVARFQTLIGKKAERRFGWDCHGLPAEMETEKELKVSGRVQIMEYGIEKFNDACKRSVMKYSKQWQEYIEKAGRWVDFEEDYRTMDITYMESVIWGFKQLYEKGLIYEDFRVMPYSWKCETPLSNFETKMDNAYREHVSKALTVKFELKSFPEALQNYTKVSALIWTTTPWTLPSNLALAVNSKIDYVAVEVSEEECVILAKGLSHGYEKEIGNKIVSEFKGKELVGLCYTPLFHFFEHYENAFRILDADFVEENDGTGIVHMAPGFGEDDWEACKEAGIKLLCPVDDSGKFTQDLYPYLEMQTARLTFKDVLPEDKPFITELLKDQTEMYFEDAEKSASFYEKHKQVNGAAPMIVISKETGVAVGLAGLFAHDKNAGFVNGNIEVVCFLKKEAQGNGLGQEIFKFFAKYAFARFNPEYVSAYVFGENKSSYNMLNSIGFEVGKDITDPRSKKTLKEFVLYKNPEAFFSQNLKFDKKGDLKFDENGKTPAEIDYILNENTYYVYRDDNNALGAIDLTGGVLSYHFIANVEPKIAEEALKEILLRFSFSECIVRSPLDLTLRNLGFFEIKKGYLKRNSEVLNLSNRQVFETNDDIIFFLKSLGRLVKQAKYTHNYPHCWRTDTPLIYKTVSSWYVNVVRIKDRMIELNKQVKWIPAHIKDGQFGKWLENARDWSITRNRFWGTPVPVWKVQSKNGIELPHTVMTFPSLAGLKEHLAELSLKQNQISDKFKQNEFWNIKISSKDGGSIFFPKLEEALSFDGFLAQTSTYILSFRRNYVFGGIKELEDFFDKSITDLHRPFIDELKIPCPYNPENEIVRVSDVLDCWFESGSMPFASVHYPFENRSWFESHNPADFIVEYVAQTRGWFYTLMVLSTAIFDRIPFKTCLCHGVILDANGDKLSKRLQNYPDPLEVFKTHGSDALRWFLLSSAVVSGGNLCISKDGSEIKDVVRLIIKPIWNTYTFFAMYANADGIIASFSTDSENIMDRYILSKLSSLASSVKFELEKYDFMMACKSIEEFIDVLNNWYIRRNKERFWKEEKDTDKIWAHNTLYTVLLEFCKIVSPLLPFISESIFVNLTQGLEMDKADLS